MQKEKIQRAEVLRNVDIVEIVNEHIPLKRKGKEYEACCPFHEETTPSFKVSSTKQIFKCFGCGAHGDAIEFTMRYLQLDFIGAVKLLAPNVLDKNQAPITNRPRKGITVEPTKDEPEWEHIIPVPANAPKPNFQRKGKNPTQVWSYTTPYNQTIGYICRYEDDKGKKEVIPYIFAQKGDVREWKFLGFAKPRPLWNLPRLIGKPSLPVIIVEGEKAAKAAHDYFGDDYVVTTWIGGVDGEPYADFTVIENRQVYLWADNDDPGRQVMKRIADRLSTCELFWVPARPDAEPKEDVADLDIIDANKLLSIAEPYVKPSEPVPAATPVEEEPANPFLFLGWDKNESDRVTYNFYVFHKRSIVKYSAGNLGLPQLLELADLSYWEEHFPAQRGGVSIQAALNWLIRESDKIGRVTPKLRGRGAWIDRGRAVIHTGPHLIVDGVHTELHKMKSKYIYENTPELGLEIGEPATVEEIKNLQWILQNLNWEREVNWALLLGWCTVAPVCGILNWRPHIWLTGPSGAGKTWVFHKIVRRLLGDGAISAQGDSTEAGIRQTLGHDARPVVFDEAEGESEKDAARMQNVLALMRTASADDGGSTLKGTATGSAREFKIRSCFAYASIVPQIKAQADRNRITLLGMRKREDGEALQDWEGIQRVYLDHITDEFIERFRSRTFTRIKELQANIQVFVKAATLYFHDTRRGDQVGTLLGAMVTAVADELITEQEATAFLNEHDWREEFGLDKTKDELALLSYLLETIVPVQGAHGRTDMPVGELIRASFFWSSGAFPVAEDTAKQTLLNYGIKADTKKDLVYFSYNHSQITKLLAKTPWKQNHHKILQRLPGAEACEPIRFGPGSKSRCISVPISFIVDETLPSKKSDQDEVPF